MSELLTSIKAIRRVGLLTKEEVDQIGEAATRDDIRLMMNTHVSGWDGGHSEINWRNEAIKTLKEHTFLPDKLIDLTLLAATSEPEERAHGEA